MPEKIKERINKEKEEQKSRDIARYIFAGSATMTGVCLTIISFFTALKVNVRTFADEILGVNAFLFIVSCFISYLSLRTDKNKKLEWIADILFFIGLFIMILVGFIIIKIVA